MELWSNSGEPEIFIALCHVLITLLVRYVSWLLAL